MLERILKKSNNTISVSLCNALVTASAVLMSNPLPDPRLLVTRVHCAATLDREAWPQTEFGWGRLIPWQLNDYRSQRSHIVSGWFSGYWNYVKRIQGFLKEHWFVNCQRREIALYRGQWRKVMWISRVDFGILGSPVWDRGRGVQIGFRLDKNENSRKRPGSHMQHFFLLSLATPLGVYGLLELP